MSSSAQHHSPFCTFEELARPQIFSIATPLALEPVIMEPEFLGERNHHGGARSVYNRHLPMPFLAHTGNRNESRCRRISPHRPCLESVAAEPAARYRRKE